MSRRIVLVAMLLLAVILPVAGTLSLTAASQSVSLEGGDFVMFGAGRSTVVSTAPASMGSGPRVHSRNGCAGRPT